MFAKIKSFFGPNAVISVFLSLSLAFLPFYGLFQPLSAQAATQQELQQQLQQIQDQINALQQQLSQTQTQKNTLQNKINQLQNQENQINLQIKSTNLLIDQLDQQMTDTQQAINDNQAKADQQKAQIKELLLQIYESDNQGLTFALANDQGLSGFLDAIDRNQQLSKSLSDSLDQIKQVNTQLAQQQQQYQQQQDDAQNLLAIKALQQQDLQGQVDQQAQILQQTKGQEAQYESFIATKQAQANDIRNQIYALQGVSQQISFGQAVQIAQYASQQTGVRAAFLLAILTQESNLGQNVGTCNRAGDPPSKSWRVIMKPDRDQQPFQEITSELGLNIDATPVSCPMHDRNGNQIGWGGAMGPAQFIPSTWMGYKDKVSAITGKPANPWNISDAFLAAAIKLAAAGATNPANEWAAAMRYFSGGTNLRYRFYGDSVVNLTSKYVNDIQTISGT